MKLRGVRLGRHFKKHVTREFSLRTPDRALAQKRCSFYWTGSNHPYQVEAENEVDYNWTSIRDGAPGAPQSSGLWFVSSSTLPRMNLPRIVPKTQESTPA